MSSAHTWAALHARKYESHVLVGCYLLTLLEEIYETAAARRGHIRKKTRPRGVCVHVRVRFRARVVEAVNLRKPRRNLLGEVIDFCSIEAYLIQNKNIRVY